MKHFVQDGLRRYPGLYAVTRAGVRQLRHVGMALRLVRNYAYDWRRYVRWSHGVRTDRARGQAERALLKNYHGIEKGLSLQVPRPGFGQPKVAQLMKQLDAWFDTYGYEGAGLSALSALKEYQAFNERHGTQFPPLDRWLQKHCRDDHNGGTVAMTREEMHAQMRRGEEDFFLSRHSMRNFGPDPVPMDDIRRAAIIARKTPSVCNRQGPRVHCFETASEALQWQPGNAGFGHLASRALVVTSDLQAFSEVGERNQCWVDGGMFAMSILYALHAMGYASCPLAWSQPATQDRRMRAALGIGDNEAVIMMIAVGTVPACFNVAKSHRFPLEKILIEHPGSSREPRAVAKDG